MANNRKTLQLNQAAEQATQAAEKAIQVAVKANIAAGKTFGPKGVLRNVVGSCAMPQGSNMRFILTLCNSNSETGAYEDLEVGKKWNSAANAYKLLWREKQGKIAVGQLQFTQVRSDLAVVNCIVKTEGKIVDSAMSTCMDKLVKEVISNSGSVHMSDSTYEEMKSFADQYLITRGINVTVYSAK